MIYKYKRGLIFILFCVFFLSCTFLTFANDEPELSLYPNSGTIEQGKDFTIDVLIDTKGQDVTLVRAVLEFDPELVQVTSAQRNEDIFCDWPSNEQLVDNDNGIVMATGFCQSGADGLYATAGEADIFVRINFTTVNVGELKLDWKYSGRDEPMNSVIIKDGSPPQNVLNFAPASADYTIEPERQEPVTKTPETGLHIFENISSTFLWGGGIFLLAFLTNILLDPKRRYFSKSRTIVVYDDEKK